MAVEKDDIDQYVSSERQHEIAEFAELIGLPVPRHIGRGLFSCVADITPDLSKLILNEHSIERNRNRYKSHVEILSDDMAEGEFQLTHQSIAFNDKDKLFDGQHRLCACISSEVPFSAVVSFNVSEKAMVATDLLRTRKALDAAQILGITFDDKKVSDRIFAAARVICDGPNSKKRSVNRQLEMIRILREPLAFVFDQFPASIARITPRAVMGAIGRAWYHEESDRLAQFCQSLKKGYVDDPVSGSSVVLLNRWLQATNNAGASNQPPLYFKTENAINHFCRQQRMTKLVAAQSELYPLPDVVWKQLFLGSTKEKNKGKN